MRWVILCFLILAVSPAPAQENAPAQDKRKISVQLTPPPFDGTVSAGVFDEKGNLIRILLKDAEPDTLPAALNGWILSWDGKKSDGSEAPAGKYWIRGVIAGDVKIEGEAWHFNDWMDPEHPENAPVKTEEVELLPAGGLRATQIDAAGKTRINEVDKDGKIVRSELQESAKRPSNHSFVARGNDLVQIDPTTGAETKLVSLPVPIALVAARLQTVLVSDGARVFEWRNNALVEMPAKIGGKILDVEVGKDGSFWVVTDSGNGGELRSYDRMGGFDRQLPPDPQSVPIERVTASEDDQALALIGRDDSSEVVRVLQLVGAPSSIPGDDGLVSYWKTIFQRRIVQCQSFGIDPVTGKPVAKGDLPPANPIDVALIDNPLEPGKKDALKLCAQSLENGVWISTETGLPLLPATTGEKTDRFVLLPGKQPGAAKLFVLQHGAVAEFRISGLEQLMQIFSDEITWPPAPSQKIDEDKMDLPGDSDDL
ncbi:MAG TPA: hypothetical protein VIT21_00880 [Chthoniobacterales bacterium]